MSDWIGLDRMDWLSYTTVTPRASLQSDANKMGIPRILLQKNSASTFAFVFLISFSLSLKYDSDNYHSWFWRLCWFPCVVGGAVSPVLVLSWHNLNMRSDFCNQVFSFSENDLEDDDKLDCTGGYDNDDDDIYILWWSVRMYIVCTFLLLF